MANPTTTQIQLFNQLTNIRCSLKQVKRIIRSNEFVTNEKQLLLKKLTKIQSHNRWIYKFTICLEQEKVIPWIHHKIRKSLILLDDCVLLTSTKETELSVRKTILKLIQCCYVVQGIANRLQVSPPSSYEDKLEDALLNAVQALKEADSVSFETLQKVIEWTDRVVKPLNDQKKF